MLLESHNLRRNWGLARSCEDQVVVCGGGGDDGGGGGNDGGGDDDVVVVVLRLSFLANYEFVS